MMSITRRQLLLQGSACIVGFSWLGNVPQAHAQAAPQPARGILPLDQLDSFLALERDGSVVIYSGKVDLGTGHRIAMRQMVGEELSLPVSRIAMVEGDSALTPNQGPTAGSSGVMRGGVELRQAAATMREGLLTLAAQRLGTSAAALTLEDGRIVSSDGRSINAGELTGGQPLKLPMNPKASLKAPSRYTQVGQPLPRPDIPAKVTGRHVYVHDFALPGLLHARIVRPSAVGATLQSVDESSVSHLPGVQVVRMKNFVAVASTDEWAVVRAARELKAQWNGGESLTSHEGVIDWMRKGPFAADEDLA
jgi:CO/xanthine dehydrogenase Mo-binding subunit